MSVFLCELAFGQAYSFYPGNEYNGVLEMDMYTEHYVYVGHDSPDTAYITWRIVENTCNEGWDFQMCDWQHCYDGMPNTAEMNGVPAGGQGYLKLLVNPFDIAGSGLVHFWVYPTDLIDDRQDVTFYFNTSFTSTGEQIATAEQVYISNETIHIISQESSLNVIYDMTGKVVMQFTNDHGHDMHDVASLSSGLYILKTATGKSIHFLKP